MQLYFSHMVALMTLAWLSFRNISMYLGRPAVCMHAFWMRVGGWVGVGWLGGCRVVGWWVVDKCFCRWTNILVFNPVSDIYFLWEISCNWYARIFIHFKLCNLFRQFRRFANHVRTYLYMLIVNIGQLCSFKWIQLLSDPIVYPRHFCDKKHSGLGTAGTDGPF